MSPGEHSGPVTVHRAVHIYASVTAANALKSKGLMSLPKHYSLVPSKMRRSPVFIGNEFL